MVLSTSTCRKTRDDAVPFRLLAGRRRDGDAKAPAAVVRVNLDRGEAGPAADERQPGDRQHLAAVPDAHERLLLGRGQDLTRDRREVVATPVVVPGGPGVVRLGAHLDLAASGETVQGAAEGQVGQHEEGWTRASQPLTLATNDCQARGLARLPLAAWAPRSSGAGRGLGTTGPRWPVPRRAACRGRRAGGAELARPVNPSAARSSQSPSHSSCVPRQCAAATRSSSMIVSTPQ